MVVPVQTSPPEIRQTVAQVVGAVPLYQLLVQQQLRTTARSLAVVAVAVAVAVRTLDVMRRVMTTLPVVAVAVVQVLSRGQARLAVLQQGRKTTTTAGPGLLVH
jgi:hypothetical protein